MDLLQSLNRHYEFALGSKTEREFYEYVYYYFAYIHQNPTLLKIFENAQLEYTRKHSEIWNQDHYDTDEELDLRSQATYKMEHFDMFSLASAMYVRIYWKIDNYKNTIEPDAYQDPLAVALIKDPEYASRVCSARYPERGGAYKKEILKNYNSWYENKREFYERELRDFHFLLLNAIDNLVETSVPTPDTPTFKFDIATGDFSYNNQKGILNPKSQEYLVFKHLYESENQTSGYLDLIHQYNPKAEPPIKSAKDDLYIIIRNLKQKFGILSSDNDKNPDFIVNVRGFGYRLMFKTASSE